jgi:hypothetical protein
MSNEIEFTPAIADAIINGILDGKTQQFIAAQLNVSVGWISKQILKHPLFGERVRSAREEAAHVMVDDAIHIADTDKDSKRARVCMQARQFAAERRNRKAYAPSIDMTLDQRVDIGGTLIEARKRIALPVSDLRILPPVHDVEYVQLSDRSPTDTQTAEPVPFVNPFD